MVHDPIVNGSEKSKGWVFWGSIELKTNHLLYMEDLKLYGKTYEKIDALVQTMHTVREGIGMEFGIKKCGIP